MTEQTPPTGEPTATPSEGVGAGADEGAPPPPPPADHTAVGEVPPPPPPPAKSHRNLILAIVAGVVVLAMIATAAVLIIANLANQGEDKHSIAIPSTAAGMDRDKGKETELKQQLDAAEQQFETQAKNVSYVKSGVYNQDDTKRGPEGALVFLGAKLKTIQNPTKFVDDFGKQASSNGFKIDNISAGEGGGKAVCAYQSTGQKVAICAWATKDSMGELVPTVPGYDSKQLSKILLELRDDVETTD